MNNEIYGRVKVPENDRGRKKSAGKKQTIRRVSGRLNFHWVSIINHWVGFHWVSVNEGCLNGAWCSYSNLNFALGTNLFDGRKRKRIENTKTATWWLPCSPNKLTAAQRVLSDSKAFE